MNWCIWLVGIYVSKVGCLSVIWGYIHGHLKYLRLGEVGDSSLLAPPGSIKKGTSAVIQLVGKPLLSPWKEAGLLEGTRPGEHVSLLQSQPASGSRAIQKTPSFYPQEFSRIPLP